MATSPGFFVLLVLYPGYDGMMYFVVVCEAIFCQQKCLGYLVFDDRNDKSKAKHRSFGDDKARGCEC